MNERRSTSGVLKAIFNTLKLGIDAHFAEGTMELHIITDHTASDTTPGTIDVRVNEIQAILRACKDFDADTLKWGLDASYKVTSIVMDKIYEDKELTNAVSKLCDSYKNMEDVNFEEINTLVKDILGKRGWVDENGYITPILLQTAKKRYHF